jgi:hypothetical protein
MTILKIVFFVSAFFLVVFTVMANMGGNSDSLKSSIEQFAMESTGLKAKIKTLNNMNFFPTIVFDFEGMDLFKNAAPDVPAVHVERLRAALSFWDAAISSGNMKALDIQGITAMPGVFIDKAIRIESAAIINAGENGAAFEGKGMIGAAPASFSMGMTVSGSGRSRKYRFGTERAFAMELGGVKITAQLKNAQGIYLAVEDLKISLRGEDVMTGRLEIVKRKSREIGVTGALTLAEGGTVLKPALVADLETRAVSGTLGAENFNEADFQENSRFDRLIAEGVSVLGSPQEDSKTLDEFFKSRDIKLETSGARSYSGPLTFENNRLKIQ